MSNIKNYTSSVPVDRTVSRIEQLLIKEGAKDIMKNYNDTHELIAISFRIFRHNKMFAFKLPANVHAAGKVMFGLDYTRLNESKKLQAQRTAWKNIQEWTELQIALVKMQQADIVEVFLPYLFVGDKSLFHSLMENNFSTLALPENV